MIIFYAGMLVKDRDELPLYWKGLVKHMLYLVPIIGLLLLEPHLSASMVIIGIVCVMMIVAGCKFKHFAFTGLGFGVPGLALLIAIEPYRLKRFIPGGPDRLPGNHTEKIICSNIFNNKSNQVLCQNLDSE